MATTLAHPIPLFEYWRQTPNIKPLHQSNPEPFTKDELEAIIGDLCHLPGNTSLGFAGTGALEQALSTFYSGIGDDCIGTFAGAQEATFCLMHSILSANDRVGIITPAYTPLALTAEQIGCKILPIPLIAEQQQWTLDIEAVKAAVKQCKALVINFPNNPTGALIDQLQLNEIIKLCDQAGCWLISDEVFRGLEYDARKRLCPVAEQYERGFSIGVTSKAFALPATRIGWICSQHTETLAQAKRVKLYLSMNNSLLDESIVTQVIQHHEFIWQRSVNLIKPQAEQLNQLLQSQPETFHHIPAQAGCCCFPLIKNGTAHDFAQRLAKQTQWGVLPSDTLLTKENGIRVGFGFRQHTQGFTALGTL